MCHPRQDTVLCGVLKYSTPSIHPHTPHARALRSRSGADQRNPDPAVVGRREGTRNKAGKRQIAAAAVKAGPAARGRGGGP
eukprot:scaffold6530_cov92-Isochrysis_galbana.AAC.1